MASGMRADASAAMGLGVNAIESVAAPPPTVSQRTACISSIDPRIRSDRPMRRDVPERTMVSVTRSGAAARVVE